MPDPSASRTPDELTARRREALELLRAHLVADRLDVDGYERWASAILGAGTVDELDAITRALRPAPPSAPPPTEPRRRRRWGAVVAAVAAGVVVIVAVRQATDEGSPRATVQAGSEESIGSEPYAARRQHLADVIAREGTLDACPDADALIDQVGDERADAGPLRDRLADYAPPTLLDGQLDVVLEDEEDDYQTGRLWLDASLQRFVPRRGLTAEYQAAEGHGPRVAIFAFELDDVAQATAIRDDAIRAFVCAPDAEPWSPTDDLIGGRSDQILGEAILTQVDGARVVFFIAGAGLESAATRDAAALRSAQEVLG